MTDTYALLDSGDGKKLERYGPYTLVRPASQAIWKPTLSVKEWDKADGIFTREEKFKWIKKIPEDWHITISGLKFHLSSTDFGHLGVFPEQKELWKWFSEKIGKEHAARRVPLKVLNLFAYSGGGTLMAAREGAEVCHLDASKGMVSWARENAALNNLEKKPIRWIVDDVRKFLQREIRRKNSYDAIILDPPSYGKGSKGEVFKFEKDLYSILEQCRELLSKNPSFILLSSHTTNITPVGLQNILSQVMQGAKGKIEHGEIMLSGAKDVMPLPNGTFARWVRGK